MSKNRWVVMVVLGWLVAAAVPARAQSTRAEPAAPPTLPTAPADMERAQRAASNPMRIILEAGKIRRRAPDGAASAPPADVPATRRTAARPAPPVAAERSAPAARTRDESPPAARSTGRPDAAPAPAAQTASVAATPAVLAASASATPALAAQSADPGPAATAVAAPVSESTTGPPVLAPAASPSAAQPVAAALAQPQPAAPPPAAAPLNVQPHLVTMVEPEIPSRVLDQIGRLTEVLVELVIRRDGSVASVKLLPPAPRQVQRFVVEALEKWRFEPLPQERVHRVQLVFSGGS